ncbi:hypothetical protein JXB22_11495 [candidate division WOR-3 bacterium]|nr:hypothetical protein [candidate division WOR-3 bacterium]
MANFWNDFTKWLDDASKVIGKEAGDLTLKGRLKLEIFELGRSLKETYMKFGIRVYDLTFKKKNANWVIDKEVAATVKKIRRMETTIKKKQQEYKKVGGTSKRKKK